MAILAPHFATNINGFKDVTRRAREFAFATKYGDYDYKRDLRSIYLKKWYDPIFSRISEVLARQTRQKIIGIGANNGHELAEMFGDNPNVGIEVLDISQRAVELGKQRHTRFLFHVGDMEQCQLQNGSYDIYLNLRSIHSSGVEIKAALAECRRILKPGGFAVLSISNGYLSEQNEIIYGMYDTRNEVISLDKPYRLAEKIREKLVDYDFETTGIETGL